MSSAPLLELDFANEALLGFSAQARVLADNLAAAAAGDMVSRAELHMIQNPACGERDLAAVARRYLRARHQRRLLFAPDLFSDPAWDLLLDLFASRAEGHLVSITDASIAAGVPQTTGLRWIAKLERARLIRRRPDPTDSRRTYVELTTDGKHAVGSWLTVTFQGMR
jgi:DNA-binding MarR family transcriptional regulator